MRPVLCVIVVCTAVAGGLGGCGGQAPISRANTRRLDLSPSIPRIDAHVVFCPKTREFSLKEGASAQLTAEECALANDMIAASTAINQSLQTASRGPEAANSSIVPTIEPWRSLLQLINSLAPLRDFLYGGRTTWWDPEPPRRALGVFTQKAQAEGTVIGRGFVLVPWWAALDGYYHSSQYGAGNGYTYSDWGYPLSSYAGSRPLTKFGATAPRASYRYEAYVTPTLGGFALGVQGGPLANSVLAEPNPDIRQYTPPTAWWLPYVVV